MHTIPSRLTVIASAVSLLFAPLHNSEIAHAQAAKTSPCAADSSFQRLAFWVGDWAVYDSTGKRYAAQRVRRVVEDCAITAEWTGPVGDKGISISSYDVGSHDWKQVYVSNQVPSPLGVQLRKSDPTYDGPGIRFVALLDPPTENTSRLRITLLPVGDRVEELFESSADGGATWRMVFKAEHRHGG
ncbi:MAG TPA: hypothetical protein VJ852_07785 [Gemmatimonadaceae bacterium]|nr:hypothetical protein [Gemmatimonadaceae bacterium]